MGRVGVWGRTPLHGARRLTARTQTHKRNPLSHRRLLLGEGGPSVSASACTAARLILSLPHLPPFLSADTPAPKQTTNGRPLLTTEPHHVVPWPPSLPPLLLPRPPQPEPRPISARPLARRWTSPAPGVCCAACARVCVDRVYPFRGAAVAGLYPQKSKRAAPSNLPGTDTYALPAEHAGSLTLACSRARRPWSGEQGGEEKTLVGERERGTDGP